MQVNAPWSYNENSNYLYLTDTPFKVGTIFQLRKIESQQDYMPA